jgi:hypothetical protein
MLPLYIRMVNYANGKIYKIVGSGMTYYGSTCESTLARRLAYYVGKFKMYKCGKHHYVTSFDIFEHGDYAMTLVENFSCVSKDELHAKERYYIENNECINKYVPLGTNHEYYEQHKEYLDEKQIDYNMIHKEQIRQWRLTKNNCECGGRYTNTHKSEHTKSKKHQDYLALNN